MISEDTFLDFSCPYCGEALSYPATHIGRIETCHVCAEAFIVPPAGTPAAGKIPLPIKTPRLVLRRFAAGDWKDLLELHSDETLWQHSGAGVLDEAAILEWLEKDRYVKFTSPDQVLYLGIQLAGQEKLIGYIALNPHHPTENQATFSLWIGTPWQRQGYGLEAADALLDFCLLQIQLHRVEVSCDSRNEPARRFFAKLGLRQEGKFIKNRLGFDGWASTIYWAALQEEFRQAAEAAPGPDRPA